MESAAGLWVDRIGRHTTRTRPDRLRILGQYAVVHIERGAGEFLSEKTGPRKVAAGDTIILFPREPNLYYPAGEWATLAIVWNGPDAGRLEEQGYLDVRAPVVRDVRAATAQAFQRLAPAMEREDPASVLERKALILELVAELHRATRRTGRRRHTDKAMDEAVAHLSAHYADRAAVPDLAARFHLSPTHFRRLFAEYAGRSPRAYVTAVRLAHAKRLLAEGLPLKDVATRVGYEDIFYFMRVFKRVVGASPGRFAALHRAT